MKERERREGVLGDVERTRAVEEEEDNLERAGWRALAANHYGRLCLPILGAPTRGARAAAVPGSLHERMTSGEGDRQHALDARNASER